MNDKNYYEVLGISTTADIKEIKAAYRFLVKQYHPDINDTIENTEKMKELNIAYGILIDPDKRSSYDREMLISLQTKDKKEEEKRKRIRKILIKIFDKYSKGFLERNRYLLNFLFSQIIINKICNMLSDDGNLSNLLQNISTEMFEELENKIPSNIKQNDYTIFTFYKEIIKTILDDTF